MINVTRRGGGQGLRPPRARPSGDRRHGRDAVSGAGHGYDGVNRAGVSDVRYSQFRPDVVRIAIYLDDLRDYRVDREATPSGSRFGAEPELPRLVDAPRPAELQPPAAAVRPAAAQPEVTAAPAGSAAAAPCGQSPGSP